MNIAFDYSGTIDTYPEQFTYIGKSIQAQGGSVYIISAVSVGDLAFDQVIIKQFPWVDKVITFESIDAKQQKLDFCRELNIEVFYDDLKVIVDHLNLNGILAFRVWRVGQEL